MRREYAGASVVGRDDVARAVAPGAIHPLPNLQLGDLRADFDDLADLLVAPGLQGVVWLRPFVGDEQPPAVVPTLMQIWVGPTVGGQLGAGADAGEECAEPYLGRGERSLF